MSEPQNSRRDLLKLLAAGAASAALPGYAEPPPTGKQPSPSLAQSVLPRWRGFNLLDMFTMQRKGDFPENDFRWIRDLGFNFVRLPLCYRLWIKDNNDYKINEPMREIDPSRTIIADGLRYGTEPIPELADLGIAQSTRAYSPQTISHYKAPWATWFDREGSAKPAWPGQGWDRQRLEQHYQSWADLARQGVGVHCGEGGAYNRTPHPVVLAWLRDVLEILTGHGIGLALWNFRGPFGILDSGRKDVRYEDFHGHPLDRKLLELLREF